MTENQYHGIKIPLPDVYINAGPEVFKNLGRPDNAKLKNILIIPSYFLDILYPDNKRKGEYSDGGTEAVNSTEKLELINVDGAIARYNYSDKLDVAVVNTEKFETGKSIEALEEKIKTQWKLQEKTPEIITTSPKSRLKYKSAGLSVAGPDFLTINADIVNKGKVIGTNKLFEELYKHPNRPLPLEDAMELLNDKLYLNQIVQHLSPDPNQTRWAIVEGDLKRNNSGTKIIGADNKRLRLFSEQEKSRIMHIGNHHMKSVVGVTPLDMEQYIAFQYGLLNPNVNLSFICGGHSSGKTLLALATALDLTLWYNDKTRALRGMPDSEDKGGYFNQIIILKPNDVIGGPKRDEGTEPGHLLDKIMKHLKPFEYSFKETSMGKIIPFESLFVHPKMDTKYGLKRDSDISKRVFSESAHLNPKNEIIEVLASGYIRGITATDKIVIVDEAQNFTPYEMKTILQRIGPGSKCIVTGDPQQRDNPDCSKEINGLTAAINSYIDKPYSFLFNLVKNRRHQISEDSDRIIGYSK
ncbi:MAG: PhoH family protein [archaeon]